MLSILLLSPAAWRWVTNACTARDIVRGKKPATRTVAAHACDQLPHGIMWHACRRPRGGGPAKEGGGVCVGGKWGHTIHEGAKDRGGSTDACSRAVEGSGAPRALGVQRVGPGRPTDLARGYCLFAQPVKRSLALLVKPCAHRTAGARQPKAALTHSRMPPPRLRAVCFGAAQISDLQGAGVHARSGAR